MFWYKYRLYRKSYEEENLKPQDILTLMFSFKNMEVISLVI